MKRFLLAVLAAAVGLALLAPAAGAADSITIRKLDLSAFPRVTISAQVVGPTPELGSFTLRENEQILTDFEVVPIGKTDVQVGVVLVIDVSGSMRAGNKLQAAKDAAKQFVASKGPNDQVALVVFSDQSRVVTNFTGDTGQLTQAIDGLAAAGETALFDGVRTAATLFTDRPELQANVVLLSDGADTVSQNGLDEAKAAVAGVKAAVFAVGLRGGDFDANSLDQLARASGGQYAETTDAAALSGLYSKIQSYLQNQYEISYTSTASGTITVSLAAAGVRTSAGPVNAGSVSKGSVASPQVVKDSRFAAPFRGSGGLVLIGVMAFLAAALVVLGVSAGVSRETPKLDDTLSAYGSTPSTTTRRRFGRKAGDLDLAQTAVVRRAVDATARLAKERGLLEIVERKLEQADLPVKPAEALFFYLVGLLVFVVLGFILQGLFGAAIALIVVGLAPIAVVNYLGERRRKMFTSQLPDMLQLLASTLRAGYSLLQGADAVAGQVDDPMGKELRRVLVESRLGRPVEQALEDSARRIRSNDYDWAVMAIKIQREVGGNLAELLQTVSETMVARERLRRDINSLTAEGRISAIVLACLPLGIGAVVYTLNPEYLRPMLHRGTGQALLVGASVVAIAGFAWMRKIIDIET